MNILKAQYGSLSNDIISVKLPDDVKIAHVNKLESLSRDSDVNIDAEVSNTIIKWQRRLCAFRDGNLKFRDFE